MRHRPPQRSASHQARAPALVAMVHISLVAMALVFGRRASLVAMVRISLVAMVRVSPTPADNPPTTHRPTQKLLW